MSFQRHKKPTLVLICGLPGAGKTTLARKIEQETKAVRLCPDEWMADLGLDLFDEPVREKLQVRLWRLAEELLRLGKDVILEDGLWTRKERDEKRREAAELEVRVAFHYLDVPFEELWRRVEIRNVTGGHGTCPLTREQMQGYAKVFQAPDAEELALFERA